MGYLYVKIIESKKVAVRNSFFVNYPFIRVVLGKEKKTTNFKPGVEWWDKIFTFKQVPKGEHQQIIIQARDKSIHVFGSDWLGEIQVDLDRDDLLDERVHQKWYKFSRGRKSHSRSPRGYVHVAFQYSMDPIQGRPFSTAPVEKVLTFEEWLASDNSGSNASNWSSSGSQWGIDHNNEWSSVNNDPLRKSAPSLRGNNGLSPDEPRSRPKSTNIRSPSSSSINPDSDKYEKRKLSNTKQRSSTMPDVLSPTPTRKDTVDSSSGEEDSDSDSEEPRTGNLIDLSFDAPKSHHHKKPKSILKNSHSVPSVVTFQDAPTEQLNQPSTDMNESIEDKIERIKRLSLATTPVVPPQGYEGFSSESETAFADWYKPNNPFLDAHNNFAPATSKIN